MPPTLEPRESEATLPKVATESRHMAVAARAHPDRIRMESDYRKLFLKGWLNEQRWTVSYRATSIRAACMRLGYAWYAEGIIRKELDSGELKPLPLREGAERWATLYLIFADRDAAGPSALRMTEIIREGVAQRCPKTDTAEVEKQKVVVAS